MIIDCHCHAGKAEALTAPWTTTAPLAAYLRRARAAGIDKTVVFPLFHENYSEANADVARIIAEHPDRLIGFAFVHTKRDAGHIFSMVKQATRQWNFRGIKVHGFDAMPTREVCEAARAFSLPMLVDVGGKTQFIDLFATEYPDVKFIIPHLGSFADDWRAHQSLIDKMVRLPNVYTDTSGVSRFDYIVQAVRRVGARRILFGSDGPWLHPGVEIHKIRLLGLPPRQESLILGGNILRLIQRARTGREAASVMRPFTRARSNTESRVAAQAAACSRDGYHSRDDQSESEL